jgi:hypothetical protein
MSFAGCVDNSLNLQAGPGGVQFPVPVSFPGPVTTGPISAQNVVTNNLTVNGDSVFDGDVSVVAPARVYQAPALLSAGASPVAGIVGTTDTVEGLVWDFTTAGSAYNAVTSLPGTYLLQITTNLPGTNSDSVLINDSVSFPIVWDGNFCYSAFGNNLAFTPVLTTTVAGALISYRVVCQDSTGTPTNKGTRAVLQMEFNNPVPAGTSGRVQNVVRVA